MLCLCCGQELFIDIAPTVFGEGGSAISMISPGYLSHLPHLSGKNQDDWLSIRIQDLRRRLDLPPPGYIPRSWRTSWRYTQRPTQGLRSSSYGYDAATARTSTAHAVRAGNYTSGVSYWIP